MLRNIIKKNKKIISLIVIIIFFCLFADRFVNAQQLGDPFFNTWLNTSMGDQVKTMYGSVFGWLLGGLSNIALAGIFTILSLPIYGLAWLIGQLSVLITYILFQVVQYNNFVNENIVIEGWVMVRDLCNMFFILGLLVIAFATILRMETYGNKRMLGKLLIMAVLINFSKTICGLFIDFAQVIMLTFVQPIIQGNSETWGWAGLVDALGLAKFFTFNKIGDLALSPFAGKSSPLVLFSSMVLGLIFLIIATVAITAFTIILFIRIVTLWILVILSPLPFLLSAFPGAQQYATRWWGEFSKALVVGPTMAFFFWLALRVSNLEKEKTTGVSLRFVTQTDQVKGFSSEFANQIVGGDLSDLYKFIIVIIFLFLGMSMAQAAGGMMASVAGNASNKWSRRFTIGAARWGGNKAAGFTTAWLSGGKEGGTRERLRTWIGNVSGGRNYGGTQTGKIPGMARLATRAQIGLGAQKRSLEEQAEKYVNSVDLNTKRRLATMKTYTPWGQAVQAKALNQVPTVLTPVAHPRIAPSPTKTQARIDSMSKEDFNKLSEAELTSLGKTIGLKEKGKFKTFLEQAGNVDQRGAYNFGRIQSHQRLIEGVDRNGNVLTNRISREGNIPSGSKDDEDWRDRLNRKPGTKYERSYSILSDEEAGATTEGGADTWRGRTHVGGFGAKDKEGEYINNILQVDFDKLGLKELLPEGHENYDRVGGVNLEDKETIGNVATKMVSVIDERLNALKLKGDNLAPGEKGEIRSLERAKERLEKMDNVSNLQLVNTGAKFAGDEKAFRRFTGEKISHETFHGAGDKHEERVDAQAKNIADEKNLKDMRSRREQLRQDMREMSSPKYIDNKQKDLDEINRKIAGHQGNDIEHKAMIEERDKIKRQIFEAVDEDVIDKKQKEFEKINKQVVAMQDRVNAREKEFPGGPTGIKEARKASVRRVVENVEGDGIDFDKIPESDQQVSEAKNNLIAQAKKVGSADQLDPLLIRNMDTSLRTLNANIWRFIRNLRISDDKAMQASQNEINALAELTDAAKKSQSPLITYTAVKEAQITAHKEIKKEEEA